jgi:hypothetical protein
MRFIGLVLLVSVVTLAGSKEVSAQQGAPTWVLQEVGDTEVPENPITMDFIGGIPTLGEYTDYKTEFDHLPICIANLSHSAEAMIGRFDTERGVCTPFSSFMKDPNGQIKALIWLTPSPSNMEEFINQQWILTYGGGEGDHAVQNPKDDTDGRVKREGSALHRRLMQHLEEDHGMTREEALGR